MKFFHAIAGLFAGLSSHLTPEAQAQMDQTTQALHAAADQAESALEIAAKAEADHLVSKLGPVGSDVVGPMVDTWIEKLCEALQAHKSTPAPAADAPAI